MVQRHERRRFTLRVCILWCEGSEPHTASSRFPIPRCVFLHHWRRDRDQFCRNEESCVIIHHDESSWMTHNEAVMFVLRLADSVRVIPWPLVWWCKGTYGGASLRDFGVCGAKASHHTPRHTSPRLPIPRCVPLHHRRSDRDQLGRDEESCVIKYHNASSCMTHG